MRTAKTRESLRSIKVVDKTEGLAKKSKNGASSLANSAEETQNPRHETEVEYAGNEVQDKEERSGRALVRGAARVGQWGYRTTVRNIQRWRNRPRKIKLKVDAPKELPPPQRPLLTEGAKGGAKTASKGIKNGSKAAKSASKASAKAAKKTAKTSAKAAKKAAKASAKAARAGMKASVRAAQAIKRAAIATVKFIKVAVKAIIATAKAVIAGVKALVAAIAAGGWVAVLIIVIIVLVALVAGSIFAIFIPAEQNGITVYDVMGELDREFHDKEQELLANCQYDVLTYEGEMADWNEIVAIYAVKLNLDTENPQEIATFDEAKADELRNIYRTMNNVRLETRTETKEVKKQVRDENGNLKEVTETVTTTYVTVKRTGLTALQA
ncbi:MAG: hypothetical protein IJE90_02450, partial [Clostridia bacterium]|nr:hypothetical protein [Clostridia bacterium]